MEWLTGTHVVCCMGVSSQTGLGLTIYSISLLILLFWKYLHRNWEQGFLLVRYVEYIFVNLNAVHLVRTRFIRLERGPIG
jgi:hypothetical protein